VAQLDSSLEPRIFLPFHQTAKKPCPDTVNKYLFRNDRLANSLLK
jgi:hypothetical protein